MKKRIFALLLSALLLTNATACHPVREPEGADPLETITTGSTENERFEDDAIRDSEEATVESTDAEGEPPENGALNPNPPTGNAPQPPAYTEISLQELQDKLDDAYVTTECRDELSNIISPYKRPSIQIRQDPAQSNVFYITSDPGYKDYSVTVTLSHSYEMADLHYNYVDYDLEVGYIMIFNMDMNAKGAPENFKEPLDQIQLRALLKTTDGGQSWNVTEYEDPPTLNSRELIFLSGFITEQIGFFSAGYVNGRDCTKRFSDRTFWTLDGGETWFRMSDQDQIIFPDIMRALGKENQDYGTELSDIRKVGDIYLLTVRVCHDQAYRFDGKSNLYIQYYSTDLKNWELVGSDASIEVGSLEDLQKLVRLNDESYAFSNFITENIGYYFVFDSCPSTRLQLLFKTEDGGNSWSVQGFDCGLNISWKEDILCAKMLDENVGIIAGKHYADDGFSRRTYLTADGGKTWVRVVLPPDDYYTKFDSNEYYTYIASGEAYDLLYEDGQYILCLREILSEDPRYVYFQYVSTDLKTWKFVE